MRRWCSLLLPALFVVATPVVVPTPASKTPDVAYAALPNPAPPSAARRPVRLSAHGIERVDPYAWLRASNWKQVLTDPSALAPEIRGYIDAENRYAEAVLAPLSGLRTKLVEEMKGRIEEEDSGVPAPSGDYAYWTKYLPGAEHQQVVRSRRSGGPAELLIDGPRLAEGKSYFSLGDHRHSPDQRLYAYLTDESGSENYRLRIRDIGAGRDLPEAMTDVSSFAWSQDSSTLLYVKLDENHRPLLVFRHRLGTDPAHDQLIYKEDDPGFEVAVAGTRSGRFVVISSTNDDTSEQWLIESASPDSSPRLVAARSPNVRYSVDDWSDRLVIRTNADDADDYKIVTAPASAPGREHWRDLLPHQPGRRIVDMVALAGHLIRLERDDGIERLVVHRKTDGNEYAIWFGQEVHSIELGTMYEFDTSTIRFRYSSPATPKQTFDYDVESQTRLAQAAEGAEWLRPVRLRGAADRGSDRRRRNRSGHAALPRGYPARRFRPAVPRGLRRVFVRVSDRVRFESVVADRSRLRLRHCAYPRRERERRALAQLRTPHVQDQFIQRFHRGGRISEQDRLHLGRADRRVRRLRRRSGDRSGRQRAARPVRRHGRAGSFRRRTQHDARRQPAPHRQRLHRMGRPDPRSSRLSRHRQLLALRQRVRSPLSGHARHRRDPRSARPLLGTGEMGCQDQGNENK